MAEHQPTIPGGPPTAAEVLDRGVVERPDHPALVGRHGRYSWLELDVEVNRAAHALRALGVDPGHRVAVALPNDVDIVIAFLACMRLGAIWLGVNPALAPPEKAYLLRDSGATVVLAAPAAAAEVLQASEGLPSLERVVRVAPNDAADEWRPLVASSDGGRVAANVDPHAAAALAYTSGTTGHPKGGVHSQHNLLLPGAVARARGQYDGDDRVGVVLPLTLVNLIALGPLLAWQTGATCVAIDRVDAPGLAEWIRTEQVTAISTVPTIMHGLLTDPAVSPDDLASLRTPGVGGADCPEAFRALYRERFGREVTIGYGLTEAPTAVTMTDPARAPVPESAGRALPHVRLVIVDEHDEPLPMGTVGEICVAPAADGPFAGVYTPMLGYWGQPDASAEALRGGMLHTGDLGYLDADGELFVRDRRKDLIIRGGANVYPAEVERVLHEDTRVAACAVVGVADERLGERVVAFVETAGGVPVDPDELRAHCAANLARYKVPEEIRFVDSFPRTPMGKIKKPALRALL